MKVSQGTQTVSVKVPMVYLHMTMDEAKIIYQSLLLSSVWFEEKDNMLRALQKIIVENSKADS